MRRRAIRKPGVVGQAFRARWSDLQCKIINVQTSRSSKPEIYTFEIPEKGTYSATKSAFEQSWVPLDYNLKFKKK